MPTLRGVDLEVGVAKGTTWGTSVATGANAGHRVKSITWDEEYDPLPDESYNADRVERNRTNVGRIKVPVSFTMDMKYDGMSLVQGLLMGTSDISGVGPYVHVMYRKNDMTGLFCTLTWTYGGVIYEVSSAKVSGATFTGTAGGKIQGEFRFLGRVVAEDTGTNPNLSSLTENSTISEVHWLNSVIDYQDIAFNGTLADLEINSWTVTIENGYEEDDRAYTSELMREPSAARQTITGSITVPHQNTTYLAAVRAGTHRELKLDHDAGASTTWGIWLPSIKLTKATAVPSDMASVSETWDFKATKSLTTPTGYSSGRTEAYIQITNSESASPLA